MDIDPYKIPAFQRRNKITPNKSHSLKMDIDPEIKILNRMKKENLSARRVNRAMDFEEPILPDPKRAVRSDFSVSSWRKMERIGSVDQYFSKINVIAINLEKPIKVGERLVVESPKGLFEERLESMQINRQDVKSAKRGDDVGIKVKFEPLPGGSVYKVVAEGE